MNIYITGINEGCGKTVVSAGIAAVMQSLGYKTGVYKPIQTGAIDKGKYLVSPDLTLVKLVDSYITTHSTYMLKTKALPVVGSAIEKIKIDIDEIKRDYSILTKKTETVVTEAPCSLMSPVYENLYGHSIPLNLNLPVLFVVSPSSDSVGQYLAEINCAKSLGLDIIGVIINKYQVYSESEEIKTFPSLIEKYSDVKVLGLIRNFKGKSISAISLISEILNGIDLEEIFRMKISKLSMY